jgi:hypothetical protein
MKVFISWSGEPSRTVARSLRQWLPSMIHHAEPWMLDPGQQAGARWTEQIQRELSETEFGILCVTPENSNSPWLLFEAGALAESLRYDYVCPYLIGIDFSQLREGPLAQFQAMRATKEDTRRLVFSMNQALGDRSLEQSLMEKAFEVWWPDLEYVLSRITIKEEAGAEVKAVADERSQLLFRKHSGQRLSLLEEQRLEGLTTQLKRLLPPVSVGELKRLLAMTEDVEAIRERARERRRRLISN